ELQSFQKVYAPFDGVITVRNVDPGSLITAGSTTGTTMLFSLAQVDMLRIFVYVPQANAPDIKVGESAKVSVRVALVDPDGTLHYQPVQIGHDYGNTVEVLSGLEERLDVQLGRQRRRDPRQRVPHPLHDVERRGGRRLQDREQCRAPAVHVDLI